MKTRQDPGASGVGSAVTTLLHGRIAGRYINRRFFVGLFGVEDSTKVFVDSTMISEYFLCSSYEEPRGAGMLLIWGRLAAGNVTSLELAQGPAACDCPDDGIAWGGRLDKQFDACCL